jgi:hypothetical protein
LEDVDRDGDGLAVDSCERSNEFMSAINDGEYLDYCNILKKGSVQWS